MKKLYLVLLHEDGKEVTRHGGAWNTKVEYMGCCQGIAITEDGKVLNSHTSSTFAWLRLDLQRDLADDYEVVDYIGKPVPFDVQKLVLDTVD